VQELIEPAQTQFDCAIEQVRQTNTLVVIEYSLMHRDERLYYEARLMPLMDDQIIIVLRDITKRKMIDDQLRYLSIHEPLTKLYNRAYFQEEMHRCENNRLAGVGIIMCDVDGLKLVNDSQGHNMGDRLLTVVSQILKKSFRSSDVVARVGGDEFAMLLPGADQVVIERTIHRIQQTIAEYSATHPDFPVSISVGYAMRGDCSYSLDELYKEADYNMYREKLHRSQSARSAIVQALQKTLEERNFITKGHTDRLQSLVVRLAKIIKLSESSINDLRLLAQFHEIGKVGVPDQVLFKSGSLTAEERSQVQLHCEIGHRIAQSAPDLAPISGWILKHHEW
jgi:diguanylate cyclase (GGDEF)-like protein